MTGIERLRTLAGEWDAYGLGGTLEDVARQIERERACDEDAIENVRLIVGGVVDEMEHHVLGHEGADDSPVARWARELRRALKSDASDERGAQKPSWHDHAEGAGVTSDTQKVTRDPAEDVSVSAYDLLPEEEREAIAWVRDHGGIESVKAQRRESMPRAAYERKKAGFLGHIAECERALGRRRDAITRLANENDTLRLEIAQMRPRLMPEGMEWPRFESGEPVRIGDVVSDVEVRSVVFRDGGILLSDCTSVPGWGTWRSYKEPIKRPSKVLDADGVEIRVGDTVYYVDGREQRVNTVARLTDDDYVQFGRINEAGYVTYCEAACIQPNQLTHRAPVLAADGRPLREGEHVYHVETGTELVVKKLPKPGEYQAVVVFALPTSPASHLTSFDPDRLTHERPDSWERLEEDARSCTCVMEAIDLVRRAKKLAGVGE